MRNLKRTLITVKPKDSTINGDPQELQDPQQLLRRILTLFGVLIMVYDRVDDGDKFSKNFSSWKVLFCHLKVSLSHLTVSLVLARGS